MYFSFEDTHRFIVKEWKQISHAMETKRKLGWLLNKIDFQTKIVIKSPGQVSWLEHCPTYQKAGGLIPSWGAYSRQMMIFLSYINVPHPTIPHHHSLNISLGED